MGMSVRITAFISDEDPTYKKHAKVLTACIEAEISQLPKETAEYFGSKEPQEYLLEEKLEIEIPIQKWNKVFSEGYEILIKDIPIGTNKIRFCNNW